MTGYRTQETEDRREKGKSSKQDTKLTTTIHQSSVDPINRVNPRKSVSNNKRYEKTKPIC